MIELGTRKNTRLRKEQASSRFITRRQTGDLGMSKRYVGTGGSTTFSGATVSDAGLPGNFVAGDEILIQGDQRVGGWTVITATGAGSITVSPSLPSIGASAQVIEFRTP